MANILHVQENPPFRWYYAWMPLNEAGLPITYLDSVLRQPETVHIFSDIPATDANAHGNMHEVIADTVPDKGLFGADFTLVFYP